MLIKYEVKQSTLLASRLCNEYFISRKAGVRQYCYYFKEFPQKRYDKNMFASLL